MTVTVRIPTQLRTHTGGRAEVAAEGGTVRDVLRDLEAHHPGLSERIVDGSGGLRRFVNIYVGDEDVRFNGGLDAEVTEGGHISVIPAVAGGR